MRRAFITTLARLAGVLTAFFILGFACGTVVDAAFMPRQLTVIDNTVKPVPAETAKPLEAVERAPNGKEITAAETDENFEIEWALFQNSSQLGEFEATAYCNCEKCCGEWSKYHSTYTGAVPQEDVTIAVDPDVIPLNSQVFVQFPNEVWHCYTAQDIGGAIKGNKVDIYFESHEDALAFGRQKVFVSYTAPDAEDMTEEMK